MKTKTYRRKLICAACGHKETTRVEVRADKPAPKVTVPPGWTRGERGLHCPDFPDCAIDAGDASGID